MREIAFRYVVVRSGADLCEIYPANNSGPQLRMDSSGEIKTSFTGDFLDPGDAVNWLTDEIRPELILDGVPNKLGIYLPAAVRYQGSATTKTVHLEAYDRSWRVKDNYLEQLLHINANTNYITAIVQLLALSGIALISKTPTDAVVAEAREDWSLGASYLTVINDLLGEINYNELWFDPNGMAVLEPASVPTAEHIEHVLDDRDIRSMLLPSISRETDIYSAPNVIIAVCSNADKNAVMTAKSENTNPQSPLSINRRGRRIVKVVQVNNIASQTELQAYADRLRNETMITGETIVLKTGLLPGFGVNDVVAVQYGDLFAVCIERSWSMDLRTGGEMTHTLEKVVVNLG